MSTKDDTYVMVTRPVSWGPPEIEGSGSTSCSKCGTLVYISKASWDVVVEKKAKIECIACVLREIQWDETTEPLTEAQFREVMEAYEKRRGDGPETKETAV